MFIAKKILDDKTISIFKIEGDISERDIKEWSRMLETIYTSEKERIILDFCDASLISDAVVGRLIKNIPENICFLNCTNSLKNRFHSAGYSANILD
jgi:anti-anti-sigma regulatory factor